MVLPIVNERVLLLDWGIGGLSVYGALKKIRPDVSCLYISDSGFTPYGKVPAPQLAARVASLMQLFQKKYPVRQAVIACNAASTVLEDVRMILHPLPVEGVIAAGIELVKESGCRDVGVIGGARTVDSHIFSSSLPGITVRERSAQPLSALIEAGELTGPVLETELQKILAPLRDVEALLLACTHYPAAAGPIQKILPKARLLDPAARVAEKLARLLPPMSGGDVFFTTGSGHGSTEAARKAFGFEGKFTEIPCDF